MLAMGVAGTSARAVEPSAVSPPAAPAKAAAAGAAAPATGRAEGPVLPPNPENEQRLVDLAERAAAADARVAAVEAQAASELAEERAEREALQHRLDYVQAVEENMGIAMTHAERSSPPITTARTGLSLTGFLQADYTVRQSSQDQLNTASAPLNEDRFNIRRARLRAVLEREYVMGAVEFDGNTTRGATARILGAEASLRWPAPKGHEPPLLMLTVGAFKIPFGFEVLQSDKDRLFLERSTAERALFPGEYDLGARLQGGWRAIRYAVAVMNGEPAGESSGFPGRDPNHQKDVVGRVGVEVGVVERLALAAGISALAGTGFHPGTPATKPSILWQDRNQDGMFQPSEVAVAPGVSASPSSNFKRQAIGADLRLTANLLTLGETVGYGELYLAKNLDRAILPADPKASGRDITERGIYLAITQQLGEHAMVGFRYDHYNPDRDSTDTRSAILIPQTFIYQTFAFTAALTSPSGRVVVEYDVNRNHLGRDDQGSPTNLKDNAFFVRGEAKF
jgi:hypothetical protein